MQAPVSENTDAPYDTAIVGGGPAGLTCGIFLGRARRSVLIVDSGEPRNAPTWAIHGFLGLDGTSPFELRRRGRDEARRAGAGFCEGTVTAVERRDDGFVVQTAEQTFRSRTLVLAYGLRDVRPAVPGFEEFYGRSIFHCPDCDAGDFAGRSIGVIGWETKAAAMVLLLRQWTDRLALFTNGREPELDAEACSKLRAQGIAIHSEPIERLKGRDGQLESVRLASGETVRASALFFAIGTERGCGLADDLACEMDEVRPHVKVDHRKQTSVPGVYAIGDLIAGSQLAITAAADGAIAAISINKSLLPPEWVLD
jgi:thioredoxin reductase (NADPH)